MTCQYFVAKMCTQEECPPKWRAFFDDIMSQSKLPTLVLTRPVKVPTHLWPCLFSQSNMQHQHHATPAPCNTTFLFYVLTVCILSTVGTSPAFEYFFQYLNLRNLDDYCIFTFFLFSDNLNRSLEISRTILLTLEWKRAFRQEKSKVKPVQNRSFYEIILFYSSITKYILCRPEVA